MYRWNKKNSLHITISSLYNTPPNFPTIPPQPLQYLYNSLGRLIKIVSIEKKESWSRSLMKALIYPLVRMFCTQDHRINRTVRRTRTASKNSLKKDIYGIWETTWTFEELIKRDNSVSLHHRIVQLVAVEMLQAKYWLNLENMRDISQLNNYSSRIFTIPCRNYHRDIFPSCMENPSSW